MPDSVISTIPEFISAPFAEKIVSLHVDLWKKEPQIPSNYTNEGLRGVLSDRMYNLLVNDLYIAIGTSGRPSYFNIDIEMNLLDLVAGGNTQAYIDSQILFIIAKHCFLKKRGTYTKIDLIADFNDFYVFISSMEYLNYSTAWFGSYTTQRMLYADQLDQLINNHYERICTLLTTYDTFDEVDDIYLFLSSKNSDVNSLNYIYALSLGSDPFNSDDEELVFKAEEIIDDFQFTTKNLSSYGVLNGLKKVTNLRTTSFYNFYTSDESTRGEGDAAVNSSNYYDAAAAFKCMPRYIKLTWNPIQGGSGIDTVIVPISGNISNVSEIQVLNEYYFSQVFRKDSNVISSVSPSVSSMPTFVSSPGTFSTSTSSPSFASSGGTLMTSISTTPSSMTPSTFTAMPRDTYITICSSSINKFANSSFWNKIVHEFNNRETKDIVDNMIFITDHNLLRKRSDAPPRLQYVGYLIHKYEWYENKWKLKEVVMLDDCHTSCYYDFNILYNRRYRYKMSSLIKWIYSTSLIEVESFYSSATYSDTFMPEVSSESTILSTDLSEEEIQTIDPAIMGSVTSEPIYTSTVRETGLKVMGSATAFQSRIDILSGEAAREDEATRTESIDTLESTTEIVSRRIIDTLSTPASLRRRRL